MSEVSAGEPLRGFSATFALAYTIEFCFDDRNEILTPIILTSSLQASLRNLKMCNRRQLLLDPLSWRPLWRHLLTCLHHKAKTRDHHRPRSALFPHLYLLMTCTHDLLTIILLYLLLIHSPSGPPLFLPSWFKKGKRNQLEDEWRRNLMSEVNSADLAARSSRMKVLVVDILGDYGYAEAYPTVGGNSLVSLTSAIPDKHEKIVCSSSRKTAALLLTTPTSQDKWPAVCGSETERSTRWNIPENSCVTYFEYLLSVSLPVSTCSGEPSWQNMSSPPSHMKADTKGVRTLDVSPLSISCTVSRRRLVVDVGIVEKLHVFRGEGRIEVIINIERDSEKTWAELIFTLFVRNRWRLKIYPKLRNHTCLSQFFWKLCGFIMPGMAI